MGGQTSITTGTVALLLNRMLYHPSKQQPYKNFPRFPCFPWTKNRLWTLVHPKPFRVFSLLKNALFSQVQDSFCFSGRAFDLSGFDECDLCIQADHLFDFRVNFITQRFECPDFVGEDEWCDFDAHFQFIIAFSRGDSADKRSYL